MIRNETEFKNLLDLMLTTNNIAKIARTMHVDRTTLFRWIAQSEYRPDEFTFEYDGRTAPLHVHMKAVKALARIGRDYFSEDVELAHDTLTRVEERDAPDRMRRLRRKGFEGHAPDVVGPPIDDEDLLSDQPSREANEHARNMVRNGPGSVSPEHMARRQEFIDQRRDQRPEVLTQEEVAARQDAARNERPAPEPEPAAAPAPAPAPAAPMTERQRQAADHRAKIAKRVASGGVQETEIERELLARLENPPEAPRGAHGVPARSGPGLLASRTSSGDPVERTGSGRLADGERPPIKMV